MSQPRVPKCYPKGLIPPCWSPKPTPCPSPVSPSATLKVSFHHAGHSSLNHQHPDWWFCWSYLCGSKWCFLVLSDPVVLSDPNPLVLSNPPTIWDDFRWLRWLQWWKVGTRSPVVWGLFNAQDWHRMGRICWICFFGAPMLMDVTAEKSKSAIFAKWHCQMLRDSHIPFSATHPFHRGPYVSLIRFPATDGFRHFDLVWFLGIEKIINFVFYAKWGLNWSANVCDHSLMVLRWKEEVTREVLLRYLCWQWCCKRMEGSFRHIRCMFYVSNWVPSAWDIPNLQTMVQFLDLSSAMCFLEFLQSVYRFYRALEHGLRNTRHVYSSFVCMWSPWYSVQNCLCIFNYIYTNFKYTYI